MSGGSVGPLLIPANYVGCLSANQMTGTFLLCPLPAQHHTPVPPLPHTTYQNRVHCTRVLASAVAPTLHCRTSEYRHAGPELRKPSEKVSCIWMFSFKVSVLMRFVRGCFWVSQSKFCGFPLHKSESFLNSGQ